ncbi:hypothetical protein [Kitasatospora sp. NBC_01266]|uniref:hypothetical protein n=1 Tax=Kitasatospora sp. NBC_01266 TaxID=2903572 RepID=UPI002E378C9C|nr:hypothetical protein [Kitasatospora sp. NBC_01266]
MTTKGDTRSIPAEPADPQEPVAPEEPGGPDEPEDIPGRGRTGSRFGARRLLIGSVAVVLLGSGGWVISLKHPGDWLPGLGPSSGETEYAAVVGDPPSTSGANPAAFDVKRLFPPTKLVDLDTYQGRFTAARQGSDCTEILQSAGQALLHGAACEGYLAVDLIRQDGQVETSVTVLRFGADATSVAVANAMQGQSGLVGFVQTDGTLLGAVAPSPGAAGSPSPSATPSATPGGPAVKSTDPAPRVEAVRHYVTVTSSRFTNGHSPAGPQDQQDLAAATRAAAYTAGLTFVWS